MSTLDQKIPQPDFRRGTAHFHSAAKAASQSRHQRSVETKLSRTDQTVLDVMGGGGPIYDKGIDHLAYLTGFNRKRVMRSIDRLVKDGLVLDEGRPNRTSPRVLVVVPESERDAEIPRCEAALRGSRSPVGKGEVVEVPLVGDNGLTPVIRLSSSIDLIEQIGIEGDPKRTPKGIVNGTSTQTFTPTFRKGTGDGLVHNYNRDTRWILMRRLARLEESGSIAAKSILDDWAGRFGGEALKLDSHASENLSDEDLGDIYHRGIKLLRKLVANPDFEHESLWLQCPCGHEEAWSPERELIEHCPEGWLGWPFRGIAAVWIADRERRDQQ